jgi:hypothetical protein
MKRIIYKNVLGVVLSEGRSCYFVRFPYGCRFVDKRDAMPTWDDVTKQDRRVLGLRLNA